MNERRVPILRRPLPSDATYVFHAFQGKGMERQGSVKTLKDAQDYIDRLVEQDSDYEPWAIDQGGRLIGLVCVTVDGNNRSGWLWYWMAEQWRGRRWMSRAAATVADWALDELGLERLELGHRVNNPESGAVARAAGFVLEGVEREKFLVNGKRIDVANYGRLKFDFRPVFESFDMQR